MSKHYLILHIADRSGLFVTDIVLAKEKKTFHPIPDGCNGNGVSFLVLVIIVLFCNVVAICDPVHDVETIFYLH